MEKHHFAGALIRALRLEKNWSQETLARGICSVSYLSKIEQGKAEPDESIYELIFKKLDLHWQESSAHDILREALYEGIFSWDARYTRRLFQQLEKIWPNEAIGPCYLDFMIIHAYCRKQPELVNDGFIPFMDKRQSALYRMLQHEHMAAYHIYPCPLTAFSVAEEAYHQGNYTRALEYLQLASEQAAREGYVYVQMIAEHYMVNCYSDMGNLDAMHRHSVVAERIGRVLQEEELVKTIRYNIAATKAEFGDYKGAYAYFSSLEDPNLMDMHKLAICCEALGKTEEARQALIVSEALEGSQIQHEMCRLISYRLDHPAYLSDPQYGDMLMNTFENIRRNLHAGYARFHLRWVTQWLTANRQYRKAYEILNDFPGSPAFKLV